MSPILIIIRRDLFSLLIYEKINNEIVLKKDVNSFAVIGEFSESPEFYIEYNDKSFKIYNKYMNLIKFSN